MATEEKVRERLNQVLSIRRVTITALSGDDLNLKQRLYTQLAYNKKLTVDSVCVIINRFPDVSLDWLFNGVGNPFPNEQTILDVESPDEKQNLSLVERVRLLELEVFGNKKEGK